jgi:HIRAN domain-containing protein
MDRLFGRHGSQVQVETVLLKPERRNPKTDPRPWEGRTSVKVAGESYRQDELIHITGRQGSEAVKMEDVDLELVCEPDNAHDPRAVKVLAQGVHVGYLSRGNARTYCKRIEREGGRVKVKGFIGCVEGGPIGVRVHIPDDHPIARSLS